MSPATIHPFGTGKAMANSKPYKPSDPAEIARRRHAEMVKAGEARAAERDREKRAELWGVNADAIALAANEDVIHEGETRKNVNRAMRWDAFALLLSRRALSQDAHDAVRRLQKDIAIRHRSNGASDTIRAIGDAKRGDMLDSQIAAGERVDRAMRPLSERDRKLLRALAEREVIDGVIPDWHAVVRQITGAVDKNGHARHVRDAADALADSYRAIDSEPRKKREVAA